MSKYYGRSVRKLERMQVKTSCVPQIILWTLSIVVQSAESSDPQVPCFFVFGDSLCDNGNNNDLHTAAKSNYPPYGIDYPGRVPTGRFSNGKNLVDVIAGHLGFEGSVPISFASTTKLMNAPDLILKGVNYASGSAGIRHETGQHLGTRIPFDQQLLNHKTIVANISKKLENKSRSYLKQCLYMVNIGSNDYLNNYYVPDKYPTKKQFTPEKYAEVLMKQYSQQIQFLHKMGARKVVLFGPGELGCTPQAILTHDTLGKLCFNEMNKASLHFNSQLRKLVRALNVKLTDSNFTCINMDKMAPTTSFGFFQNATPCCQVRGDGQCEEGATPCADRNNYVFFDNFHPTEAMNIHIGGRAYSAVTPLDVYPVDIRTLVNA